MSLRRSRRHGHPRNLGPRRDAQAAYSEGVGGDLERRTQDKVVRLAGEGHDWVTLSTRLSAVIAGVIPFTRTCWHTVDPGTVLFTGSLNREIKCSGSWLAEHEYVIDDINRWWFLARGQTHVGASSLATHGDLSRSARHRSREGYGTGDELRASFVVDGVYWGAAGFLREEGDLWFTEAEVRLLATMCSAVAEGLRRALLAVPPAVGVPSAGMDAGPGLVVYDEHGDPELISSAAEIWISQLAEYPAPSEPSQSKIVQAVAARARTLKPDQDPLGLAARTRLRTVNGRWLTLYGTRLSGSAGDRTAVVIQPAQVSEVAPLVALVYGLTQREGEVTRLCMQGRSTKEIAQALLVSGYTVQDHLKAIFAKTGVRSRGELVGQIFLEHYVPRWETPDDAPAGWLVHT